MVRGRPASYQHPIRSLGQITCDGYDGTTAHFGWMKPFIEQPDMALKVGLDADGAVGRFDKAPLEIVVDVAASPAMADATSAGDAARHQTGIAGQMLDAWELSTSSHSESDAEFVFLP
jgi:hypothetical protein